MSIELKQQINFFEPLLEKVKNNRGKTVEIVSFAQDTVSGYKRVYSEFGILGETKLNQSLTDFIEKLVPEGESRDTLESAHNEEPDVIRPCHSHCNEAISEWPTLIDGVSIGIRSIRDQRSESVRTWYLKSHK